ncbi:MAG: methionine--tRNA ligase [Deltaproteobacteria bacterium]|nr:methionine--tRNA ligase [Deltaproteobacteria bacterium]
MKRSYITTPIYYVNAEPHLGHAYTTIVADVFNRFQILSGAESFFLTGTDEHGDKIVKASEKKGESVKEFVDRASELFRVLWPKLNISNNYFIRTTDPAHKRTVELILNKVNDKGDIYFSEYEGLYCFGCERFYVERELVDGKCPDHQNVPEVIKEANYFFRMSKYQDWLVDYIKRTPGFIRPERYKNEVLAFLKDPLEDLCISRPKTRLEWGISLPFDNRYVTYVWFDALINYISSLDYPEGELFKKYWPHSQHLIAKDILKPHGIYWPCMLRSAGIEPYQHLNVHGYWKIDQGKMSKSIGNIVRPLDLADIYGLDAFRYFLLREMVFGLDSEFSEEALIARINADLANDLGNLVSRSLTMASKYFKGDIPGSKMYEDLDIKLKNEVLGLVEAYPVFMEEFGFHKALMAIWDIIGKVNKYIDSTSPWVLAKNDQDRLVAVMNCIVESLRIISILLWPFMPETAEKMLDLLGFSGRPDNIGLDGARAWETNLPQKPVSKSIQLFPRIDVNKEVDKGDHGISEKGDSGEKEMIKYEDFQKLDLKIGTILNAEPVPKSKKLIKLTVDIGEERIIVAGIAQHYTPDEIKGKQVIVVANLEPIKLMGIESRGMILAAEDDQGVHLINPDRKSVSGSIVK